MMKIINFGNTGIDLNHHFIFIPMAERRERQLVQIKKAPEFAGPSSRLI